MFVTPALSSVCLCVFVVSGHEESVEAAGFSRHLPLAATGSIDGKLIIWDCGTFSERGVCMHDDVSGVVACTQGLHHAT